MIVENNIRLLKNIDYPLTLISDNQEIQEIDDNYDGLNTLNNLSFSIYYTFQETFQEIKDMWDIDLAKDKLNDLEIILDNLYDIKEIKMNIESGEQDPNLDYDDDKVKTIGDNNFNDLYDELCVRFDEHYDLIHQKKCQSVLFNSFTNFCKLLLKSKNYLYNHDIFLIDISIPNMNDFDNETDNEQEDNEKEDNEQEDNEQEDNEQEDNEQEDNQSEDNCDHLD